MVYGLHYLHVLVGCVLHELDDAAVKPPQAGMVYEKNKPVMFC